MIFLDLPRKMTPIHYRSYSLQLKEQLQDVQLDLLHFYPPFRHCLYITILNPFIARLVFPNFREKVRKFACVFRRSRTRPDQKLKFNGKKGISSIKVIIERTVDKISCAPLPRSFSRIVFHELIHNSTFKISV